MIPKIPIGKVPIEKLPGLAQLLTLIDEYYERRLFEEVKSRGNLPRHVGIILDGNRRFALKHGLKFSDAYRLGGKKLEEVLEWCRDLDIRHVTVFGFSTENFKRPKKELKKWFDIATEQFKKFSKDPRVHKYKIHMQVIGDLSSLPERLVRAIREAEDATRNYNGYFLTLAVAYGGRAELVEAMRKISRRVRRGDLKPGDIDEHFISNSLYTAGLPNPDPDLIIRTSGEERLSGFLLWQSAYSELYFCEAYWPAFKKIDFLRAMRTYQTRERRFGG